MSKFLFLTAGLLMCFFCKAQIPIKRSYEKGYYYDLSGNKFSGLIKFAPYEDKISFKSDLNASAQKIDIDYLKAVIINRPVANDSLTVMTEDNKKGRLYFAKLILKTPHTLFYHKFRNVQMGGVPTMSTGMAPNIGAHGDQPAYHTTYKWSTSPMYSQSQQLIMYNDGNTTHELTKGNFIQILSSALADDPELVEKIENKVFKFKEVNQIFFQYKMAKPDSVM
jgi:hypothetical protein